MLDVGEILITDERIDDGSFDFITKVHFVQDMNILIQASVIEYELHSLTTVQLSITESHGVNYVIHYTRRN